MPSRGWESPIGWNFLFYVFSCNSFIKWRILFLEDLDNYTVREYLNQVKRLVNTKQKNILLRIWNGDCLSYSRLSHFGIVPTSQCPNCHAFDSPLHMLTECVLARQVWQQLKAKIPIRPSYTLMQYAIGINDSSSVLMVEAEILKYLMHFRDCTADQIVACVIMYLKMVNRNNPVIPSTLNTNRQTR